MNGGKIFIKNTFYVVATDNNGNFILKNVKKGKFILKATYIGYVPLEKEVDLTGDMQVNFEMDVNPVLGEEVIISASRASDKTPMTYENISKSQIQSENLGQDIPILIDNTPSATTATDAGTGIGYTYLRIRGTDATRVNVTLNGVPYNNPDSHEVYWVDLPDFASSLDNIQIQRGVGASTNGASAFGASINLQTNKLNPVPFIEYDGSVGSFNTMKNTLSFGSGLMNNNFEIDGRFSKISSDGYVDRASADLKSFFIFRRLLSEKIFYQVQCLLRY